MSTEIDLNAVAKRLKKKYTYDYLRQVRQNTIRPVHRSTVQSPAEILRISDASSGVRPIRSVGRPNLTRPDPTAAAERVFARRRRFRRDFDACGTSEQAAPPSAATFLRSRPILQPFAPSSAATAVRTSDRCSAGAEIPSGSESLFRQFRGLLA